MLLIEEKNGSLYSLQTKETGFGYSGLAMKILHVLAKKPNYPKEIALALKEHEQKIYYHVRKLEKLGLIKIVKKEERGGSVAKFYALAKPSFCMRFREMEPAKRIIKTNSWLEPFITDGKLNAKIVVGSPDPHGPEKARSRDASYAIDLGLFFGTFITESEPVVCLDTELANMKSNLIVIGGPVVNRITRLVNEKMPVRFDEKKYIYSSLTKKTYRSDDCGIVVKARNPFDDGKKILVIAGRRYSGTRAAILALLKKFDEITEKNARIVEGIDADYDGIIDDVRILE